MKLVVILGTVGLLSGALWMFQPPSHDAQERARQQQQQRLNDLDDANGIERDRRRERANAHLNAEHQQQLTAGEHRPPEPRFRLRLP